MPLYHLIYQSQALAAFSIQALTDLLQKARAYNTAHHITGMLLYAPNEHFVQVLEGEEREVRQLYYGRIALDPRHEHKLVLSEGASSARLFPDWCMSFRSGPPPLLLPGYIAPSAAFVRVCNLTHPSPGLKRLLLDFAAGHDDSSLYESMVSSKV